MFQRVFENFAPDDFGDPEENDETSSTLSDKAGDTEQEIDALDTTGLGSDELVTAEVGELEESLDLLMLGRPRSQNLEFNLNTHLDPASSDRYLVTTALDPSSPETQHYMYHINALQELVHRLKSISEEFKSSSDRCDALISAANLEIDKALSCAWDEWSRRKNRITEMDGVRIVTPAQRSSSAYMSPVALSAMILTAICHAIIGVSRQYCNFILDALRGMLLLLSEMQDSRSTSFIHQHLKDIPTTLPTVLHHLNLPPTLDLYACCPKCSSLYPEKPPLKLPEYCTTNLDAGVCGESLGSTHRRGSSFWLKPTRRYSHMLFESWVGEFLMRPGVEDMLEAARPSTTAHTATSDKPIKDVWDAPYLASFPGHGEPPFLDYDRSSGELRLVMLLYHDFLNPFQNKTAGKVRSIGCFFMICLNLPPGVRYNASNAYLVSMVPGPHETRMDDLNIFIGPIVEDMLEMYSSGIWVSKTHKYPQGRKVRAAIAIGSFDTIAARGTGGFGSHSHNCFCQWCNATRAEIDACDLKLFKPRDIETHRQQVQLWLNASSKKERSRIYDLYGVRYTDWLKFSWWDPGASFVVGPMHWGKNILEKDLRENKAWSWTLDAGIPTDGTYAPGISQYEHDWGVAALNTLSASELDEAGLTAPLVRYLCCERGIFIVRVARPRLIEDLNRWRAAQGMISRKGDVNPDTLAQYNGLPTSVARARFHVSKPSSIGVISSNASKEDLIELCRFEELSDHGAKNELIERLVEHYSTIRVPLTRSIGSAKKTVAVLGKQVLAEVQSDMDKTTLPSWLKHPPRAFATLSHGKIQAEEYKSLALVSFTITLVRLWATDSGPYRDRLDHFLHLMLAVRINSFQSLISSDLTALDYHYEQYLSQLKELYPDSSRTPVQHMGLHISSFLRSMGPSTRFSESTCELFNGILQGIHTNFKFGDLELTLHREFVMAARLKGLVEQRAFTQSLGTFGDIIRKFLDQHVPSYEQQSSWRTTHANDPFHLTSDTISALNSWAETHDTRSPTARLFFCRKLQRGNVIYAPASASAGNSCIQFFSPQKSAAIAGRIDFILEEPADAVPAIGVPRIFLIVRPFAQLTPQESFYDPYLNHPIIGKHGADLARLYHDSVEAQAHVILPKDLISHVAVCSYDDPTCKINESCVVVLSLDLKHERYA